MSYARKRDANHGEIEAVFRRLLGDHVTDTSALGMGIGDLYVSFGAFPGVFIEIKRDAKAEYTAQQTRFQGAHPYAVLRCESTLQAERLCAMIRRKAFALAGALATL